VSGGDLFDRIYDKGGLDEDLARKYLKQIAAAIAHCHDRDVVHRDIKPENCIITRDDNVKVTDFGLSNVRSERHGDIFITVCGTTNYAAPEVLSRTRYRGTTADVWSLGVLLYVMLTGSLPFDDHVHKKLVHKIDNVQFIVPPGSMSAAAEDLIRAILVRDPCNRLTIHSILDHPWTMGAGAAAGAAHDGPPLESSSSSNRSSNKGKKAGAGYRQRLPIEPTDGAYRWSLPMEPTDGAYR